MSSAPRPCKTVQTSDSFHRHLNQYALAAAAAGVGALALAQPAEGKIVYTPAHVIIGYGGTYFYKLDLNHDGAVDIYFGATGNACTSGCRVGLWAGPPGGNEVRVKSSRFGVYYVAALRPGAKIGKTSQHHCVLYSICDMAHDGTGGYGPGGEWLNVRNRYVGLKFDIHGKSHFGWVRLSVAIKPTRVTATLTGYAYETVPHKPIIAGKTKGPDVITVQSGSLGALAAGRKKW
jgi:hypothetical protein